MDSKIQKYMQRIQRLMHSGKSNVSPMRRSKSPMQCKTNQLDKYLKYELSSKIINNFIAKNYNQLISCFFNGLKSNEYRHKQVIYKFVAIEKQQKGKEMNIDCSLSCKILATAIKQVYKSRFHDFINALRQTSQTKNTTKALLNKQGTRNAHINSSSEVRNSKLMRTTTNVQAKNFNEVKQWIDNQETQNQTKKHQQKILNLKKFVGKSIAKIINQRIICKYQQFFMKALLIGAKNEIGKLERTKQELYTYGKDLLTQNKNQAKIMDQKAAKRLIQIQNYKGKVQKLNNEVISYKRTAETYDQQIVNLKQTIKEMNTRKQKQEQAQIVPENKHVIQNLLDKYVSVHKRLRISEITMSFPIISHNIKQRLIKQNLCQGLLILNKFSLNIHHHSMQKMRNSFFARESYEYKVLLCEKILKKIHSKKQLSYHYIFCHNMRSHYQKITSITQTQEQQQQQYLTTSETKSKLLKSSSKAGSLVSNAEPSHPLIKLNFYQFIDRIYKLILVVSKMLIPMKEAFKKIDEYASYQYKIQQSLKIIPMKYLRIYFDRLKMHTTDKESPQSDLKGEEHESISKICDIIGQKIEQNIIQSFSIIKIMSKQRDFKIKVLPVKNYIVENSQIFMINQEAMLSKAYEQIKMLKKVVLSHIPNVQPASLT